MNIFVLSFKQECGCFLRIVSLPLCGWTATRNKIQKDKPSVYLLFMSHLSVGITIMSPMFHTSSFLISFASNKKKEYEIRTGQRCEVKAHHTHTHGQQPCVGALMNTRSTRSDRAFAVNSINAPPHVVPFKHFIQDEREASSKRVLVHGIYRKWNADNET
jgi:hypothetical protein